MSFDPPEENKAFREKFDFPFALLTDESRQLGIAFGACDDVGASHAGRVTAVLDGQGKLLRLYDSVNPKEHPGQILSDLGAPGA